MPVIVAVYDSEKDLDETLNQLYSMEVASNNVIIMSPHDNAGTLNTAPSAASSQGASISNTPGLAADFYHGGVITDMEIGMTETDYYNRLVENGATVLFVEVEMDKVNAIEATMKGATRVDRL